MYIVPAAPPRPVPLAASLREIIRQFTPNCSIPNDFESDAV